MIIKGFRILGFVLMLMSIVKAQEWTPKPGISYRGLSVLNDKVIWASGTKGTVIRTDNGGKTWKDVSIKTASRKDFRDIHSWDEKNAIVMSSGDSAEFYRTKNGGKTWQLIYINNTPGIFFDAMDFKGEFGVFLGDPLKDAGFFTMLTYNYSQNKFDDIAIKMQGFSDSVNSAFAASGTCITYLANKDYAFCSGSGNKIRGNFYHIYYNSKQQTIVRTELPLFVGNYAGAYSICALSKTKFIVVGGSFLDTNRNDSVGAYSNDGGITWNLCKGLGGYRSCVQAKSKIVLATGTNGSDISTNGGKTFQKFEQVGFNTCMLGNRFCWFVGDKGRILKKRF